MASKVKSPHDEFSQRSHLLRWFHERSLKELQAMKDAWHQHQTKKKR